jgi:hypothetical protein
MNRHEDHLPVDQRTLVARSEGIIPLIDQVVLDDAPTSYTSRAIPCGAYRHFGLYLRIKSASTPTTVQIFVDFLDELSGLWHVYKQGLFASLIYEDQDVATEQQEIFNGDLAGRSMRVRAVGTGTTSAATFTVSAAVELWT